MDKRVQFTKIRDVKSPNRANMHDAGIDFFIPNYTEEFAQVLKHKNAKNKIQYHLAFDEDCGTYMEITLGAHEQICIPSGIKVNIMDKNTYLDANNKSGVATKYSLIVGAKVIDADYQGEVHINLINTSNKPVTIRTGQKIVQFIHKEYIPSDFIEIANEEYDSISKTDRGEGGFASTGEQ